MELTLLQQNWLPCWTTENHSHKRGGGILRSSYKSISIRASIERGVIGKVELVPTGVVGVKAVYTKQQDQLLYTGKYSTPDFFPPLSPFIIS